MSDPITLEDLIGLCPQCKQKKLYRYDKGITTDDPQYLCSLCGSIYTEQAINNWRGEMLAERGRKD